MNISQNKTFVESNLTKLHQKMLLFGISVDVKEPIIPPNRPNTPIQIKVPKNPPNTPIQIKVPKNPPNTPVTVIEMDSWPCRDEKCNEFIDNKSELIFNGHPERMCPKCGTTRFKP
jgi:hypothetical protein